MIVVVQGGEPTSLKCDENLRPMRSVNIAKTFVDRGIPCVVLVPNFSHQYKKHRFSGRKIVKDECGIEYRFLRSPGYSHNKGFMRFLDHLVFGLNVLFELVRIRLNTETENFQIFCGYPQVECALFSVWFSKIFKIECCVDIKDDWPASFMYGGYNNNFKLRIVYFYYKMMFSYIAKNCSRWVTISSDFQKLMEIRSPVLRSKPKYVAYLSSSLATGKLINIERRNIDSNFTKNINIKIIFAGTLSQGVYDFSSVLKLIDSSNFSYKFLFAGSHLDPATREKMISARNVTFEELGWMSEAAVLKKYEECQLFVVPISSRADFMASFPNKFLDGLSVGCIPIVPSGSAMGNLCLKQKFGVVYDQNDTEASWDQKIRAVLVASASHSSKALNVSRSYFDHERNYDGLANFVVGGASHE